MLIFTWSLFHRDPKIFQNHTNHSVIQATTKDRDSSRRGSGAIQEQSTCNPNNKFVNNMNAVLFLLHVAIQCPVGLKHPSMVCVLIGWPCKLEVKIELWFLIRSYSSQAVKQRMLLIGEGRTTNANSLPLRLACREKLSYPNIGVLSEYGNAPSTVTFHKSYMFLVDAFCHHAKCPRWGSAASYIPHTWTRMLPRKS